MPEMSESTAEISCENCVAACCKAPMTMWLTADEHKVHGKAMDLQIIAKPRRYEQRIQGSGPNAGFTRVPAGLGVFELKSDCSNLDAHDRCSAYATRPQCCRDFTVGSPACRAARRDAGLEVEGPLIEEEITPEPDAKDPLLAEFFPSSSDSKTPNVPAPAAGHVNPLELAVLRTLVDRESQWIGARLYACEAAEWSRRTRCGDWNVGRLAAHLVSNLRLAHSVLTAAIERHAADDEPEFRGDREETVAEFRRSADRVDDALARITSEDLERDVVLGRDDVVTAQNLVQVLVMELVVHGLDLADALGVTRHLTAEAVSIVANELPDQLHSNVSPPAGTSYVLRSSAFELSLTWRSNAWRREPGSDSCRIEGEPEAVLLYALGRVPFNKSGLVTNRPDRARAFKRHLVGP